MTIDSRIQALLVKWNTTAEGYRCEARRLESADGSRHATWIAMLETSAQSMDRCILELEALLRAGS